MKARLVSVNKDGEPYNFSDGSHQHEIDEHTDESWLRRRCPHFFNHAKGMRERREYYRGCVICRHTMSGTNWRQRQTVLYLLDVKQGDTYCVGHYDCNPDARKVVDELW